MARTTSRFWPDAEGLHDRLRQAPDPDHGRNRLLTAAEFHQLADVPPEVEWFANLSRRAYDNAVRDFMRFAGIVRPADFRTVARAHIIAWRDDLVRRGLGGSKIRHRLSSLASPFEYLCEKNAVTLRPTSPRCRDGPGMRILRPCACTITAGRGRKTAQRLRSPIDTERENSNDVRP